MIGIPADFDAAGFARDVALLIELRLVDSATLSRLNREQEAELRRVVTAEVERMLNKLKEKQLIRRHWEPC